MKGKIVYSSMSGNTKKFAEKLGEHLADLGTWTVEDLKDAPDYEGIDCILLGAWVDRGMPNKKALEAFEALPNVPVGIFVTMGAMPDSFHGTKVGENLEKLLEGRESLGYAILPGLVDPKVLAGVRKIPENVMPKDIRDQMVKAGEESRWASEEEYDKGAEIFKATLKKYF